MPKQDLLAALRRGMPLTLRQQIMLTLQLSVPAILAQISSIVMQYIDASMVGQLGKEASASIGLVSTSTWLMMGLCRALVVGFSVMVAQRIGAGEDSDARNLTKQALISGLAFGLLLAGIGAAAAGALPVWLHAEAAICHGILFGFCPVAAGGAAQPSGGGPLAGQRQHAYTQYPAGGDVRSGCGI